ncbi:hypothetical protein RCL1_000381 [Eukaryota sp. TZLM3-RCL]
MDASVLQSSKLLDNLPFTISAITSWKNERINLLLGTSDGSLVHYHYELNGVAHMLVTGRVVNRKEISQLHACIPLDFFLILSNGVLYIEKLNMNRIPSPFFQTLSPSKDVVQSFAFEHHHGISFLAIAHKKKILVQKFTATYAVLESLFEIPLSEPCVSLTWCFGLLLASLKKEQYSFIDTTSGRIVNTLFDPAKSTSSHVSALSPQEILVTRTLGTGQSLGVVVDTLGRFTRARAQCPTFDTCPIASYVGQNYLLTVFDSLIELRVKNASLDLIQKESISFPIKNMSSCLTSEDQSNIIFLTTSNSVYFFSPNSIENIIKIFIKSHQYNKAKELCNYLTTENKILAKNLSREVALKHGFHLFFEHNYSESFIKFTEAEAEITTILALFPDLLPRNLGDSKPPLLTGQNLIEAHNSLLTFLYPLREILIKNWERDQSSTDLAIKMELIDTALIKVEAQVDPCQNSGKIFSLLKSGKCFCSLSEGSQTLKKFKLYRELLYLLQLKQNHKKAIDLIFELMTSSEIRDPNCYQFGWIDVVNYLSEVGNSATDIVLQTCKRIAQEQPKFLLQIFLRMKREVLLDINVVINFLEANQPSSLIPFFENLVYNFQLTDTEIHTTLGKYYLREIAPLILSSDFYLPANRKFPAGTEGGKLGHLRNRFLYFLKNSQFLKPEILLVPNIFPPSVPLHEERALLYNRLGLHTEVLFIYIYLMNSVKVAENYCFKIYSNQKSENDRNIFQTLLSVLINPPDKNFKPRKNLALNLVSRWSQYIDPTVVLDLLSPSTPLSELIPFLTSVIDHTAANSRNLAVRRYLLHSNSLKLMAELIDLQRKSVCINSNSSCCICFKRIGTSAIAFLPDNSVCHFHCHSKNK